MKMIPNALRATLIATITLLTIIVVSGCKSYQFGNPAALPFTSIYVKPVTNDSFAPQAQALLSSQLRDAFIRDGRTKLVTSEDAADVVLLVNLSNYKRRAGALQSNDTAAAAEFDLTLSAEVSLYNQNTGDYLFQDRMLEESSNAYVNNPYSTTNSTNSFLQAEYQAMSELTRDLARKISDEVLSPWEPKQ